jgi:hypothetical protein
MMIENFIAPALSKRLPSKEPHFSINVQLGVAPRQPTAQSDQAFKAIKQAEHRIAAIAIPLYAKISDPESCRLAKHPVWMTPA